MSETTIKSTTITMNTLRLKITAISDLIRLRKQYGTALLLLPTLWGLTIASGGRPSGHHLLVFILGAFLMRSAGCAINDVADKKFDRQVERTRLRPVASGRLSPKEALTVFCALSTLAFLLVLTLNTYTVILSFIAILLASLYPFVKRVSFFPQPFLGAAFGWGAVMAWAAVHAEVGLAAILIFIANILWATAYDTMYALMDIDDDVKAGIKSTAIRFGSRVFTVMVALYSLMAFCMLAVGHLIGLGFIYYAGVIISCVLYVALTRKQKKHPTKENAFKGFLANVWIGSFMLACIIIDMHFLS